jgi:peroxiredoxin
MMAGVLAACKKEKPKEVVLNATPTTKVITNGMPRLTLTQADGTNVVMSDLSGKVLLVCYNPGCDHCQREAKQLSENMKILDGYEVYFLTPEPLDEGTKFQQEYKLTAPNIHFVRAEVPQIIQALGPITNVPTFFVYRDQALAKRLEGEVSISDLEKAMQ